MKLPNENSHQVFKSRRVRYARADELELYGSCCCCFLTLTDPLRIQPWSQDRRNQTKSNRESEMSMESIQKRTGKK